MASGANSLQELANAAYCEFTYLDQPHLARVQEFFITADIKDYEKRKTFFERHFHFLCPKLEWELSFPNRQVQLEIEAIVRGRLKGFIHPPKQTCTNTTPRVGEHGDPNSTPGSKAAMGCLSHRQGYWKG